MKTKACLACTITNHYLMTLASGFYNSGQVFTFHFPTDHLPTPQFFKKRTLHSSALSNSLELDSTVLEELCKMHHINLAKSNKYLQHQSQDLAQYFFVHWWWCWQYPGYCAKVGHWSAYHSESLQSAVNTWINCHETRINHKRFAFRIRDPENSAQGIRNPAYNWNQESSTRSPESTA